ncbi:MAG: thiamine-phosphate kinase [Actinobacteria bacterium]|nr:thiamine-phosphate kinase [Actinomycetota bacterium]
MTSEFELLERLYPRLAGDGPGVPLGVGDDAAVVEIGGTPVAVAVDAVVDGVHVDRSISSFADIGWKSMAVNVSDVAAIGAVPTAAVVALGRPPEVDAAAVDDLYDGLLAAADRWEVAVVGGDVVAAPALTVAVTVLGRVRPGGPLRRDAAEVGQAVVVIGSLGLSAAGFACHRASHQDLLQAHPELLAAHRRPPAYVEAAGELLSVGATAAIDVSDGLGRDLGHIAERSGVAIEVQADLLAVPVGVRAAAEALGVDPMDLVCGGGEDLALAATLPVDAAEAFTAKVVDATVVGRVVEGSGVRLIGPDGARRDISSLGWEHGGSTGDEEAP